MHGFLSLSLERQKVKESPARISPVFTYIIAYLYMLRVDRFWWYPVSIGRYASRRVSYVGYVVWYSMVVWLPVRLLQQRRGDR